MTKSSINTVVIHKGYQPYLKYNLQITSKNNNVILIGDSSVEFLKNISDKIQFINIDTLNKDSKINFYKEKFINYSTNSFDFEWFCFERVFLLEQLLIEMNLEKVFHIDSDNVLLTNVNNLVFTSDNAYIIPRYQSSFGMAGSIHAGLIDTRFCKEFSQLYEDIYVNNSKFNLIEKKIDYHKLNNLKGGICDMTLYYLLFNNILTTTQNLLQPIKNIHNEEFIFINNFNLPEGYYGKDNFEMKKKKIKIYKGNLINDIINNHKVRIANIHFQGSAKKFLNKSLKYKLKY